MYSKTQNSLFRLSPNMLKKTHELQRGMGRFQDELKLYCDLNYQTTSLQLRILFPNSNQKQ